MLKRLLTFLLILSFVAPALYNPYQAQKAEAFLGIGDIVVDVKALMDRIFDGIAQALAQRMIDDMVKSTVKWAQSGFDGNPAYAVNPQQYFTDIADGVVGEFIREDGALGYLCSPFQANIRLSLVQNYYEPEPFQCTLTEVVGNIESFYEDFSQGGWDAWFSMTQNPTNNPYGAYLAAKIELDSRIAEKTGIKQKELDWSDGFLSSKKCIPDSAYEIDVQSDDGYSRDEEGNRVCNGTEKTTTPGSTIKGGLDKILPSGLDKLITAEHVDQLVSAFASGLLTRYVFGPKGLFASGKSGASDGSNSDIDRRMGIIDLDNDGIPDGQDADRDGRLVSSVDICYHGGNPPNCPLSGSVTNSPYFTPICEAISRASFALSEYGKFMDKNAGQFKGGDSLVGQLAILFSGGTGSGFLPPSMFANYGNIEDFKNKSDADIWSNRTSEVDSATDEILSAVRNYRAPYFDTLEVVTNRFAAYITKVQESLIKDQDLDLGGWFTSGGGGLVNLAKNSANQAKYINEVKTRLGRCDDPSLTGVGSIPTPPEVGTGEQCVEETGNQYAGALRQAMDAVLAARPDVAALPNTEANDRGNARIFLALVETQLLSMGYQATDEVLNGNNNPSTGDIIAVWKTGDTEMERYDAINGAAGTVGQAAQTNFAGFIPLNCTASGGGNDCGCKTEAPPITPPGTPPPPTGTPGGPAITSVNPTSVTSGVTTVTITGANLTTTVQFFDYRGDPAGRSTVTGSLNASGTQVTVLVPTGLLAGAGNVRIYRSATSYSNTLPITISGTAPTTRLTVATPTKVVVPTGIETVGYLGRTYNNGWWPSISPDGRYVAFGNWGDSYVLDLTSSSTKPAWNFKNPPGFPTPEEGGGRCIAGQWLSNTKLSFVCEIGGIDNGSVSFWRYEVTVGQWIPVKTSDNPSYVVATIFKAKDNHWATYQAGPTFRIIKDNQVLANNAGGALSISGNTLVHACNNTNTNLCVRDGNTLTKTYPVRTPLFSTAIEGGYILYGGYGPVHGITPTGSDIDLTLSPSRTENPSEVFLVNGARWFSTLTWNPPLDREYILLRPWGSRSAIVLDAAAVSASVVQKGSDLIVAYNDDQGNIKILTVPINSVRHQF